MRGERNPPVTASPCQPPLGKGAEGTGDADCHSQCAHWLRNDRVFARGAVGGGVRAPRPTEGYKGRGRTGGVEPRPYGGLTRSAVNGPSGTPAPTKAQQEVR